MIFFEENISIHCYSIICQGSLRAYVLAEEELVTPVQSSSYYMYTHLFFPQQKKKEFFSQ
jgi:hypothetical protein